MELFDATSRRRSTKNGFTPLLYWLPMLKANVIGLKRVTVDSILCCSTNFLCKSFTEVMALRQTATTDKILESPALSYLALSTLNSFIFMLISLKANSSIS